MESKDKTGLSVGFCILIGIGLWAVLDPTMTDGFEAVGRRAGLKQLVADYWGVKLGVGMIVIGGLALVGVHTSSD